jgi:hypothetical protein
MYTPMYSFVVDSGSYVPGLSPAACGLRRAAAAMFTDAFFLIAWCEHGIQYIICDLSDIA